MSEHFVPAVAVAIVVISASAAKADDLYIWDSRGTQIGTFVYDNLLRRQFTDKIWREVGFWAERARRQRFVFLYVRKLYRTEILLLERIYARNSGRK